MKQKIFILSLTVLTMSSVSYRLSYATEAHSTEPEKHATKPPEKHATKLPEKKMDAAPPQEQGEEEYDPKNSTAKDELFPKPPSPVVVPTEVKPEEEDNSKSKLKDFNGSSDLQKKNDAANKLHEKDIQVKGIPEQKQTKATEEKDDKIVADKLVETDDKVVETKKYSGVVWFFAVFAILLIVVFAFT